MTSEHVEPAGGEERPVIVLFRQDLRVSDNRALNTAAQTGRPVIPVFVLDHAGLGSRPLGGARRWWLHKSLEVLSGKLTTLGSPLVLLSGDTQVVIDHIIGQTGADTVLWNRRYDPSGVKSDTTLKSALRKKSVQTRSFEGHLLHEPTRLTTGTGSSYRVYSPFWRALLRNEEPREPLPAPDHLRPPDIAVKYETLESFGLNPSKPDWSAGLCENWQPGESHALKRLDAFLESDLENYISERDLPSRPSTSRLSAHLAHGEITPFQIWHATRSAFKDCFAADAEKFRKEIAWREFSYHLLFHNPHVDKTNFNRAFDRFPWADDEGWLEIWQQGRTGYPLVDAGMRQLWQTGWMHNRVRMVCASFLVKHLMIDWRHGERWFWDTLVDADPANNVASWQWIAGCGADAAPYFRVFNPILQSEKFDPDGTYVRRFVPELRKLSNRYVHRPWEATETELRAAGVELGENYPKPVVDHQPARNRALEAYQAMRGAA